MKLGVGIWLYNDEFLIRDCVVAVQEIFPEVEVYDVGSSDSSLEYIKQLNVKVNKLNRNGKLDGAEYIKMKRDINAQYDYVFNIDGDEVYPKEALVKLKDIISQRPMRVHGFWKMIKKSKEKLLVSSSYNCGEIAWDTKHFELRRKWPHEVLQYITTGLPKPGYKPYEDLFCWHGVLLNRSSVAHRAREAKRYTRDVKFKDLSWTEIKELPWNSHDSNLLSKL